MVPQEKKKKRKYIYMYNQIYQCNSYYIAIDLINLQLYIIYNMVDDTATSCVQTFVIYFKWLNIYCSFIK